MENYHLLIHSPNVYTWSWARLKQGVRNATQVSHWWQGTNYLTHNWLLPRAHISKKVEWGFEARLEPKPSKMGYGYSK